MIASPDIVNANIIIFEMSKRRKSSVQNIANFDSDFREEKNLLTMKKNILLTAACLWLLASANAQTNVSGFINANTTWNLAGSPYIVVGNAILSTGYTLTIDPGVVVKFDPAKAIQIDGELHAVGTAANRITFTSNQTVPAAGDWGKITFTNLSNGAVFDTSGNYLSGNIMRYCDVFYGGAMSNGVIYILCFLSGHIQLQNQV